MSDKSELRRLARQAVHEGRMPVRQPDRMWGGPGSGEPCSICGAVMTPQDIGLEVQFRADESGISTFTHHLHARCLAAWEEEVHARRAAKNDDALTRLHAHGGDGTIADREREPIQSRGATG
jgi:hypothetical protein